MPASAMPIIVTLAFLFYKGADINWLYGIWALVGMILSFVGIGLSIIMIVVMCVSGNSSFSAESRSQR